MTGAIKLDGRERDEIINTGTELIVVEATTSRKLDKTEMDLKKSASLVKGLKSNSSFSEYNYRILLVTRDDPTADQAAYVKNFKAHCPKEIISFTTLFSRLFDSRHYIRLRGDHSFGSVRNPVDENDLNVPASAYIPTALSNRKSGESLKAAELASALSDGGVYVIYGDYGSGKSMTLRDIYFRMRDEFIRGESIRCPVYLNLREHIAQVQPDEALYRHAEKIGFPMPHSLISAWRAGFVCLFLDGFDELTPPQFASSVTSLRQARRFAVELVKRFIEQTPKSAPILLAGRENYFDDRAESQLALGYSDIAQVFDLAGFTDADVQRYLKKKADRVPSWLPTRPLLLGYLANSGLLTEEGGLIALDPAAGWDQMLQRVCEREVKQIWGVGFEATDLRLFIDGLATQARKSRDGRGLEESDLRTVFRSVFGRDADEPAHLLTGRLPGLGAVPGRAGAREFIDTDFADAGASGDVKRYIEAPFVQSSPLEDVQAPLGPLGREMAGWEVPDLTPKMSVALSQASRSQSLNATSADLISMLIDSQENYRGDQVYIEEATF
ncbi:MAG TPA: NACHT domain-containing protein, partial [Acidobacteriaceae bacterium]|nr:NACHT domain-containing protein [Acidobacteriaceae bacterium]